MSKRNILFSALIAAAFAAPSAFAQEVDDQALTDAQRAAQQAAEAAESNISNHFKNRTVTKTNQMIERHIPGTMTPVSKRGFPASAASPFGKT